MPSSIVRLARHTDSAGHAVLELQYCGEDTLAHSASNLRRRAANAGWHYTPEAQYVVHKVRGQLVPRPLFRLGILMGNGLPARSTYYDLWGMQRALGWQETEVLAAVYLATIPQEELGYPTLVICHKRVMIPKNPGSKLRVPHCLCLTSTKELVRLRYESRRNVNPHAAYVFEIPEPAPHMRHSDP